MATSKASKREQIIKFPAGVVLAIIPVILQFELNSLEFLILHLHLNLIDLLPDVNYICALATITLAHLSGSACLLCPILD